jgi:hypothetical protein
MSERIAFLTGGQKRFHKDQLGLNIFPSINLWLGSIPTYNPHLRSTYTHFKRQRENHAPLMVVMVCGVVMDVHAVQARFRSSILFTFSG